MSLEDLHGKDCMVRAVISATGRTSAINKLSYKRLEQARRYGEDPLNPQTEADNLSTLLRLLGEPDQIEIIYVSSVPELRELCQTSVDIFIGFASGPDLPAHITHLGQPRRGGFESQQQFTSNERLLIQLDEQGQLTVFVRRR